MGSAASRRSVVLDVGHELSHRLAARTFGAVHVERQADRQRLDLMLAREFVERSEVSRQQMPLQRDKRRRRHASTSGRGHFPMVLLPRSSAISLPIVSQRRFEFGKVDDRHVQEPSR